MWETSLNLFLSLRGFCFFNSVAIAAKQLQQKLSASKILIVDWVRALDSRAFKFCPKTIKQLFFNKIIIFMSCQVTDMMANFENLLIYQDYPYYTD